MTPVALVSMPFAAPSMPSLALSLFQPLLEAQGITSRVFYFSLSLAERVGLDNYLQVAVGFPDALAVVGEWVFGGCLTGLDNTTAYFENVLDAERCRAVAKESQLSAFRDLVRELRAMAPGFVSACATQILAESPSIVGFTSVFQQHAASLAVARAIKAQQPSVQIVLGGANCEGPMGLETLRQFPFVDYVFSGEAEKGFTALARAVLFHEPLAPLPGMLYRTAAGDVPQVDSVGQPLLDLDSLPFPDFRDFAARIARTPLLADGLEPTYLFETARGCWWGEKHHCTFCGINGSTMAFRSKSPDRAYAEISHLHRLYPGCELAAVDNILDHRYFDSLFPRLQTLPGGVDLFYNVKSNLTKDQLRKLSEAGVRKLMPGIESLHDDVLRIMQKGVRGMQNLQLLRWCSELEITPSWCLLWGFPGEPPASYESLCGLIPKITHLTPPLYWGPMRMDRFSPNFQQWQARGFGGVRPGRGYRYVYNLREDSLFRLAYYFEYAYADGRQPSNYTDELAARITSWRSDYRRSRLSFVRRPRDSFIVDTRPIASVHHYLLSTVQTELIAAADSAISVEGLRARVESQLKRSRTPFTVEFGPLIENGYLLEQDGTCLSLPVPVAINF